MNLHPTVDEIKKFQSTLTGSPSEKKRALVNFIRHYRMDTMEVNVTDNSEYIKAYTAIMKSIAADYPFLSGEVERQISKKIRWQSRRNDCARAEG
jgi:hypothetical protein